MFIKNGSRLFTCRRRRYYLLNTIIIILCFSLFLQIKYNIIHSLPNNAFINSTLSTDILFTKTILNCSGDPVKQWCENEMNLCNSSLIVYKKLFLVTRSVILQPKLAIGKRLGGEDMQTILNQPEQDEYFHFNKEFIQLPCDVPATNGILPSGHLSSIFSSIRSYKTCSHVKVIINETTIAVNRQDYANIYHTITDLYTVYLLCRFFQRDPKSVRILFLDAHPKGNLDIFWSQLFHSYTRLGHMKNMPSIFYKELIWSQPQPKSDIDVDRKRKIAPSFFFDFREHVLKQFNIDYETNKILNCQSLRLFFLGRRNYVAHPRNPSGKISRQLANENQTVNDLKMKFSIYPHVNFTFNYFEQLSIEEQLKTIIQTDIFIGMHGAGLTHVIFLHSKRALVELAPSSWLTQQHFELMASMNTIKYRRCSISNESPTTAQTIFECTKEMISQMCPLMTAISTSSNPIVRTISTGVGNTSNSSTSIKR